MKNHKDNKVCLITPPATFLLDERVFPHLGILKVAANLESHGYEIDFLDFSGIENYLQILNSYLTSKTCTTFGITASTSQIPYAAELCREIKKIKPDSRVILGGAHCTLMSSAAKTEQKRGLEKGNRATLDMEKLLEIFDILVCGDGEDAIFEALKIDKGVVDANDAKSSLFLTNKRLEDLPLPARHLVDLTTYKYDLEGHRATSLIAQLGCPFMCTFCSGRNSPFLRRIRKRSSESILKEIEILHKKYNYTGFMFQDDELNVNKQMVELMHMIADYQEREGVEFRLRGFIKSELFNDAQAEAMVRAGFKWLLTGFESGDERILHNIRKKATKEDNSRCMEIAKKHGLKVKALMSIGHAGETAESVENTKNWLMQMEPEDFDCTIITTYPGSPYFDNAILEEDHYVYTDPKNGDRLHQAGLDYLTQVDYYKGDPNDGYVSYVWTDYLSASEIVKLRRQLEEDVRQKLNIPWYTARPGPFNEHSMGMGNVKIPEHILKSSGARCDSNKNF